MNSGKVALSVLTGVLVGGVIGAAFGILFAPEKGDETRAKLTKKSSGYVDDLKEKFEDFVETISDKFHTEKAEVAEKAEKLKNKHS